MTAAFCLQRRRFEPWQPDRACALSQSPISTSSICKPFPTSVRRIRFLTSRNTSGGQELRDGTDRTRSGTCAASKHLTEPRGIH